MLKCAGGGLQAKQHSQLLTPSLPVAVKAARDGGACPYSFGLFPSGEGCTDYFVKCAYGEPQPELCTEGLAYDERTHSCNWPDLMPECSVGDAERRWQHCALCR